MACVWVHFSLVQFTVLPTSLPKETDRGCVGQVWPSFRLDTKSKVQGVINNPHFKERKMNTEFWSSNTTTCNDLISPAPIFFFFFFFSLPQLARGGECRQVSISRTHLIGLHSTWLLVTTQYLTGLRLYELHKHDWFLIYIYLWWRFPIFTGKRYSVTTLYLSSSLLHELSIWPPSPRSLYGFTAKGIRRPMSFMHVDCLGFVSPGP